MPSNQNFGFFFAIIFSLFSGYSAYHGINLFYTYALLGVALVVTAVTFIMPSALTPLNKAWMRLGELMGIIANPLVLGVIFFLLISPLGLITRFFGRDELRMKNLNVITYWIKRKPPGPDGKSFKNQF